MALVVASLLLFEPALRNDYLHYDDWVHASGEPFRYRSTPSFLHLVLMGRPVCSLCTFVVFGIFDSIEGAWTARLLVVLTMAATAIVMARFAEREGVDPWTAAAWAFAGMALPGSLVIGYWLGVSCLAGGALLAALAALAAQRSLGGVGPLRWTGGAVLLLGAALASHQQIAAVYLALFVIAVVRADPAALWPSVRRYVLIGGIAGAGYLAGYMFFALWVFPDIYARFRAVDPERSTFLTDLTGGLGWLAHALGPRAFALWLDDLAVTAAPVLGAVLLILGLGTMHLRHVPHAWLRITIVAGAIVLTAAPALLTGYRFETYRLALPMSLAVILAFAAVLGRRKAGRAVSVLAAGLIGFFGHQRLEAMVAPAVELTAALRRGMMAADARPTAPVELLLPPQRRDPRTDEFGILSLREPSNAFFAVAVIRRERGLPPVDVSVTEGPSGDTTGTRLIVDLRPLAAHPAFLNLRKR